MKNKKVMSIAIRPELHDEIKRLAKRKSISTSALMGGLAEQAVKINPDDDPKVIGKPVDQDVQTVALNIPCDLMDNPEKLHKWLDVQVQGLIKSITAAKAS